jgi:hypothetical protein
MGIGGVNDQYNVGETEVTTAQWVTFLNTADPFGLNRHHLWDASEGGQVWAKYGSISRNPKAAPGQRYYVTSPAWADKPYNTADFTRSARFINSLQNGKTLSKTTSVVTTVSGTPLTTTTYTVRLSPKTETGQYTMSNRKATRNLKTGFAVTSNDEWVKAAYFDPSGGGKFSYWDYPTNPGVYVNCAVEASGCAAQRDCAGQQWKRHQRRAAAAGELRGHTGYRTRLVPRGVMRQHRAVRGQREHGGPGPDALPLGHARPGRQRG